MSTEVERARVDGDCCRKKKQHDGAWGATIDIGFYRHHSHIFWRTETAPENRHSIPISSARAPAGTRSASRWRPRNPQAERRTNRRRRRPMTTSRQRRRRACVRLIRGKRLRFQVERVSESRRCDLARVQCCTENSSQPNFH